MNETQERHTEPQNPVTLPAVISLAGTLLSMCAVGISVRSSGHSEPILDGIPLWVSSVLSTAAVCLGLLIVCRNLSQDNYSSDDITLIGKLCFGIAALAAGSATILFMFNTGSTNTNCFPQLAGPGDSVKIFLEQTTTSLDGMWRGKAETRITNADELGVTANLKSTCGDDDWGDSISGDTSSYEVPIWVQVELPENQNLIGKVLHLNIEGSTVSPSIGFGGFTNNGEEFSTQTSILLANPKIGTWYFRTWLIGHLACLSLLAVGTLILRHDHSQQN